MSATINSSNGLKRRKIRIKPMHIRLYYCRMIMTADRSPKLPETVNEKVIIKAAEYADEMIICIHNVNTRLRERRYKQCTEAKMLIPLWI